MIHLLIEPGDTGREDLGRYRSRGGYEGLTRARAEGPAWVLSQVRAAGVRGRGGTGAGRPVAEKWERVSRSPAPTRYVVANGAESLNLSRKDRLLMERYPHRVLEGLLVAMHAVGAEQGFLYVRGDAEAAVASLEEALAEARAAGLLTGEVTLVRSFPTPVSGEETAVIDALEGQAGLPQPKPPYPERIGLRGFPTVVQNVESLAAVAAALRVGPERFRSLGTPDCPGTALFTVTGDVERPGVYEVAYGTPLRELLRQAGAPAEPVAVFPGGPGTGPLRPDELDVPLTYEALAGIGSSLGAATVVVVGPPARLPEVVAEVARFFASASCGQCKGCQMGTRALAEALAGGRPEDLERARALAELMFHGRGNCLLPAGAARSVLRALAAFGPEFGLSQPPVSGPMPPPVRG
ncbi:MAG: SLBB domain-containing protein [Firmicutes bacterium]|nr:SLBB domain-containing protein [Bacillota bacterium]